MVVVSIVIPVYHAEQTLPELYHQLVVALPEIAPSFEIIFVEDGGGDRSWPLIAEMASVDRRVRGIRMSRNYGQHNALLCGIRAARHDIIVTMDDDLQHPVSEIAELLAALGPEHDVVYGAPQTEQHGLLRDVASRAIKFALASAMGAQTSRHVSAFRAFRTSLRAGFQEYRSPSVSIDVLLSWTTTRFKAIKVRHVPRASGVSGYTLRKLLHHAVELMTGFSALPLKIASVVGLCTMLFGLSIMLFVTINFLVRGSVVPGFAFLVSIIVIFSGAQLFALGIIGEYLSRIHFRSMDRPTYVVREMTNPRDELHLPNRAAGHAAGAENVI